MRYQKSTYLHKYRKQLWNGEEYMEFKTSAYIDSHFRTDGGWKKSWIPGVSFFIFHFFFCKRTQNRHDAYVYIIRIEYVNF